ncbi:MAG: hypothetical protein JKY18_12605 [Flavobacteriales bacterium]|nr:hypothetical protein [Flavobacteriales bacterium]
MILIADSGSTKTDWLLLEGESKRRMFKTSGINPYFLSKKEITGVVEENREFTAVSDKISQLYYYGAGCTEALQIQQVQEAMMTLFPNSEVAVMTDMVGAARAVLGKNKGIAAILGTGSNSCAYDGENIIDSVPSLGYLLADEGSGSYIGRLLIKSMLYGQLAPEVRVAFDNRYGLSQADIITGTLSNPMPNRFLASFCEFFVEQVDDPTVRAQIKKGFRDFMNVHVSEYDDYQNLPLGFVGSIAFFFQEPLLEIVSEFGIEDVSIIQSPIEALGEYHRPSAHLA